MGGLGRSQRVFVILNLLTCDDLNVRASRFLLIFLCRFVIKQLIVIEWRSVNFSCIEHLMISHQMTNHFRLTIR